MLAVDLLVIASALLQPPGVLLILLGVGLLMDWWAAWHWLGRSLAGIALLILYASSTPLGCYALLAPLENRYPPLTQPWNGPNRPEAIVVLGGGEVMDPGQSSPEMANARTLMRLQAAAALAKATDLPVIPSGGAPRYGAPSEAATMAKLLRRSFGLKNPIWCEGKSYNTAANAKDSALLLSQRGIQRIYLVTSALHMPRAMAWFTHEGVQAVPVPCDYRLASKPSKSRWQSWLPRAIYEEISSEVIHEYLGLLWFRIQTHQLDF